MPTDAHTDWTPEQRELAYKQQRLGVLEAQLSQRELDLATLQLELRSFEQLYLSTVGTKLAEVDALEAEIAQALWQRFPQDQAARDRAQHARTVASESASETSGHEQPRVPSAPPSEDLKRLYREAARRVHPDLALDAAARARRHEVMAEVNRAYSEGNEARLRAILTEWDSGPDTVTGDGIGAELVRVLRKIFQVESRLASIEREIAALRTSELAILKSRVAESDGRRPLKEMANALDVKLRELRDTRDTLCPKKMD